MDSSLHITTQKDSGTEQFGSQIRRGFDAFPVHYRSALFLIKTH